MWVLDASVAVKWFFVDEPSRDQALAVRGRLSSRPESFLVPPLFHSEILHVLARKSQGDAAFVARGLELLLRLGIRTLGLSERGWALAAAWACRGLSGYDATYVALAEELDAQWLTADLQAAKRVGGRRALGLAAWKA
jgi:predicted nucleic acid-binding protein